MKPLHLPLVIFAAAVAVSAVMGCSRQKPRPESRPQHTRIAPRDSDIYLLGQRHAGLVATYADNVDSVCARLLEVRATETEIAQRVDREAADAYIAGFTDALTDQAPHIADSIF